MRFDRYYLESSLYSDGRVEAAVQSLVAKGKTYESEGALWLRTTDDGDDKDRVMKKSDGTYTYFVPDVAYHTTKWERGFTKVINVQGSDHHGTIARVRRPAGLDIGIPKGYPDYVLHKMVTVMKDGREVKISKRAGSYVTVRDLIEWSNGGDETIRGCTDAGVAEWPAHFARGRDAVRFFLLSRKADTEFVFDIDTALKQNDENPVYYVQYAHARICSIFESWAGADWEARGRAGAPERRRTGRRDRRRRRSAGARAGPAPAEFPDMLAAAAASWRRMRSPSTCATGRRLPRLLQRRPRAGRRRSGQACPRPCWRPPAVLRNGGGDRRLRPAPHVGAAPRGAARPVTICHDACCRVAL